MGGCGGSCEGCMWKDVEEEMRRQAEQAAKKKGKAQKKGAKK